MTTLIAGFADRISPRQVAVMSERARQLLAGTPPVTVTLGRILYHPPRDHARRSTGRRSHTCPGRVSGGDIGGDWAGRSAVPRSVGAAHHPGLRQLAAPGRPGDRSALPAASRHAGHRDIGEPDLAGTQPAL